MLDEELRKEIEKELPKDLANKARETEMKEYYSHKVYGKVPIKECHDETGGEPVGVKWLEINKGDALFFDHKLIHKSGDNISDRIRFSCQARYMNSTSKDYASFRTSATYNPYSMKRLQRRIYE